MASGSVPDDIIYQNSSVLKSLKETKKITEISNTQIPFQVISDQSWLLTDYKVGVLTPEQIIFNNSIKKIQINGETSLIRLKGRWRILTKKIELNHNLIPNLFQACCILHNFLENRQEYLTDWNFKSSSSVVDGTSITWYAQNNETNATRIRDVFKNFLNEIQN